MADETIIIDVVAQFKDKATDAVQKASKSIKTFEKNVDNMTKKKHSVRLGVEDKATSGIKKVTSSASAFSRKKFNGVLSIKDKATSTITKATSKVKSFTGKAWKGTLNFLDKASPIVEKAISKTKSFVSKTWKTTLSVVDKFTSPLSKLKNMLFNINTLIGAVATGLATKLVVANPISMADEMTTAEIFFETKLGSKDAASSMISSIKDFAVETPFETSDIVKYTQSMLAMGFEADSVLSTLNSIGNTSAALGKGSEGIDSVVRALGQMQMKGKVSAEEMLQLTEAGVSGWDYIAKGVGKSTAEVQEMVSKGLIPVDDAIGYIIKGMDEYDGMMQKTANKTVSGLASQIKDTFSIAIVEKWGKGLQKGAVSGLEKFNEFLGRIDDKLQSAGTSLESLGEAISTKVFSVIEGITTRFEKVVDTDAFKNADLGGKIKIVWDEVIWQPFSDWWEATGKPKIAAKMGEFGESLGKGISTGLLAILGIDATGALDDGASIGASFADGFVEGFDGEAVGDALWEAIKKAFKSSGKGITDLLLPGDQGASGGEKVLGAAVGAYGLTKLPALFKVGKGLFKGGKGIADTVSVLKGTKAAADVGKGSATVAKGISRVIGSTGNATVKGSGLMGKLAGLGYKLQGGARYGTMDMTGTEAIKSIPKALATKVGGFFAKAGTTLTGGAASGGTAAAVGGGSILGGILGALGIGSGIKDIYQGATADDAKTKKTELISGTSKIAMVGTGALAGGKIGAAIGTAGGPIGTAAGALIGAGVGGIGALLGGDKFGKWMSDLTDEGGALNWNTIKGKAKSWYYGDSYDSETGTVDKGWMGDTGGFVDKVAAVKSFFSETIPEKWGEFWDSAGEMFDGIKENAGALKDKVTAFFTETIPEKWNEFWEGVGDFFTETVPTALETAKDKVTTFFTETIPEKWNEFWDGVDEFLFETVPYALGFAAGKITVFFTETLPEKWDEFWSGVGEFFEAVGEWAEGIGAKITEFFTVTLPEKWDEFWEGVGTFFTETVPAALEAFGEKVTNFFTVTIPEKWNSFWDGVAEFFEPIVEWAEGVGAKIEEFFTVTIPEKWNEFWTGVDTFFTETIPAALEALGMKITEFFTITIPEKWNNFWTGVDTFITETIPAALEVVGEKVTTFFTVTIPEKWNSFWTGVDTFFTETIPQGLATIGEAVTTFFTVTVPGYISNLLEGIGSWISEKASSIWNNIKEGFTAGSEGDSADSNAAGGFVRSRTLSWLAEEGTPEVVIPLGAHRRERAMSLWQRTGELLGVQPEFNALGGIVGGNVSETPSNNAPLASYRIGAPGNIYLTIGNITFEIKSGDNPSDILAAIQAQKNAIVELISEALYEALVSQFSNTPMAVG